MNPTSTQMPFGLATQMPGQFMPPLVHPMFPGSHIMLQQFLPIGTTATGQPQFVQMDQMAQLLQLGIMPDPSYSVASGYSTNAMFDPPAQMAQPAAEPQPQQPSQMDMGLF